MADYKQEQPDTGEPRQTDGEERKPEQTGRGGVFLRRLGTFLVTALVVLGVVAVSMMGDGNPLDRLRRWLNYGAAAAQAEYLFAADANNQYALLDGYLVVLSQNYLQFLEDSGNAYRSVEELGLSNPVLDTGGGLALAYDAGGQNLVVASPEGAELELPLEEGYGYLSARLNGSGWLAAVSEKSGYKGSVTVYNQEHALVYEVDLSSQFVVDALVTEDCKSVLLVTYGEKDGAFCTNLVRYELTQEEPVSTAALTGFVCFDLCQMGEGLACVSDSALAFARGDRMEGTYSFGGQYLQDYSFGGDFTAVFLTRYQSGSIGTLVTLDSRGNVLGVLDVGDEILDIDARGEYLAVLQSNVLTIYDRELTEYSRLTDTDYAGSVLMEEDGAALIIGSSSARRYLP